MDRQSHQSPQSRKYGAFERIIFVIACMLILGSFVYPFLVQSVEQPRAINGIIDLREWNFDRDGSVPLDGEWSFYWRSLLRESVSNEAGLENALIQVPGAWNFQDYPTQGYATYHLKVLLPTELGTYGIKTRNIRSANRLFVNGIEERAAGVVGTTDAQTVEKNIPYVAFFDVNRAELDMYLQVASFDGFSSGISNSLYFGDERSISQLNSMYKFLDTTFIVGFFLAGFYFLSLYFQRRVFREQLYIGLFSFSISVYFMITSERLLWSLFPNFSMLWILFAQISACILVSMFLSLYLQKSFPDLYPRRVIRLIVALSVVTLLLLFALPVSWYFGATLLIVTFMMSNQLFNLFVMIRVMSFYKSDAIYIAIAFLSIFIFFPIGVMVTFWTLDLYQVIPLSLPVLVMSQALYMSYKYTRSYEMTTELSRQLQTLDRLKDEFLAKTSHELKTPLNGIINISQALIEGSGGGLQPQQATDIRLIRDVGRRLSSLVSDILDYSKAKNQHLKLSPRVFDLHAVVSVLTEVFTYSRNRQRVRLRNEIPSNQFFVRADENRVNQIVTNLLDNALKYTADGEVVIFAAEQDSYVWVTIRDTGSGIALEDQERIFLSFEQLEGSLTREQGGVGLGLAITRQLVELHGGQIRVQSVFGHGTEMSFSLPAAQFVETAEPHDPGQRSVEGNRETTLFHAETEAFWQGNESTTLEKHILIVDDEISNVRALGALLEIDGYRISVAASGQEALLQLQAQNHGIHLVILDVMMPGMSGFEVCKQIRHRYSSVQLPVLLLTARSGSNELQFGLESGANDFIDKPFDHIELRSRVKTLLQMKQASDERIALEMALLQSQIQPHFIYNVLSTVIGLCYTNPSQAADLLIDFSLFLRQCMRVVGVSKQIRIAEELDIVTTYVAIEKVRFGDRIHVRLDVEDAVRETLIPPLTIQPLVENAVKHGLLGRETGGHVHISLKAENGWVHVQIADDGVGMPAKVIASLQEDRLSDFTLHNLRRRLQTFTGEEWSIESGQETGTVIRFRVPM